jgi:hypothetical protein
LQKGKELKLFASDVIGASQFEVGKHMHYYPRNKLSSFLSSLSEIVAVSALS